ncbi:hypothetical protein ABPG74_005877 [Tetrahymena malaccensis]
MMQQLLMSTQNYPFPQFDQLKFLSQQSQQLTQQIGNEEQLTASSNELESFCAAGRSKQNTMLLNPEFEGQKKNKTFLKLERKNREKKETAVFVNITQENTSISQMLNFPSRFLNPLQSTFRIQGDIIINEDAIKASLGMIDNSILANSIIPILSCINLFKNVVEVVLSKNDSICNVYFRDLGVDFVDWRYIVQRFESYNNQQFKKIADLIRKLGETIPESPENTKKISLTSCDSSTQLCNNSVFSSPYLKSETAISSLIAECPIQTITPTTTGGKKVSKGKIQSMNELKCIENEISKTGKDSLTYTFQMKNNSVSSMHFSKSFLERAGWEISQFSMFCLYNGLPELLSYDEYYNTVINMLTERINAKVNSVSDSHVESHMNQVYLSKVGNKIETQTKYSIVSTTSGISIINQVVNIKNEQNKKTIAAPPQKVRGRKHFSKSEQNTLEYNLECPLNEMDRHQHRVCKYRILHDKYIISNVDAFMQAKTSHNFFDN